MAERVVKYIVDEVKDGKYLSTILDSTPDITHVDQLSFVVRYLSKCGLPVEIFICFVKPRAQIRGISYCIDRFTK